MPKGSQGNHTRPVVVSDSMEEEDDMSESLPKNLPLDAAEKFVNSISDLTIGRFPRGDTIEEKKQIIKFWVHTIFKYNEALKETHSLSLRQG